MPRLLCILILAALLPLRTWAGDAMAIQMTAQMQTPMQAHAASGADASHPAAAHSDCHAQSAQPADTPPSGHNADPCSSCAFCQTCSTVAIVVPALQPATQALPHGLPHTASAQFTSAILALGHKPPIS